MAIKIYQTYWFEEIYGRCSCLFRAVALFYLCRYYFRSKRSRYHRRPQVSKRRKILKKEVKCERQGAQLMKIDISYVHNGIEAQPENTTCPCVPI